MELKDLFEIIVEIKNQMTKGFSDVNAKIAGLDSKIAGLDSKIAGLDSKIAGLDSKIAGLDSKIDHNTILIEELDSRMRLGFEGVNTRLDNHDRELAGIKSEIQRLKGQTIELYTVKQDKPEFAHSE